MQSLEDTQILRVAIPLLFKVVQSLRHSDTLWNYPFYTVTLGSAKIEGHSDPLCSYPFII